MTRSRGEHSQTRRNARLFVTLNGAPHPTRPRRHQSTRERYKMEIVEAIALSHFSDTRIGSVSRKQVLRLPSILADQLESVGLIKIVNPYPTVAISPRQTAQQLGGGGTLSLSLPADQASTLPTLNVPLKPILKPSRSMTPIGSRGTQQPYTPAMEDGGKSTTKPSPKADSKVSSGRKTSGQQKSSD